MMKVAFHIIENSQYFTALQQERLCNLIPSHGMRAIDSLPDGFTILWGNEFLRCSADKAISI